MRTWEFNPNDPTQKMKTKFRSSKAWKDFKQVIKAEQGGKCAVTGGKLTRTANLHHKDLDASHYADISDKTHFVFLSNTAHETVHWLWRSRLGWRTVMKNIATILEDMESINGGKTND